MYIIIKEQPIYGRYFNYPYFHEVLTMNRILLMLLLSHCITLAHAVGPNELNFDGTRYYKVSERSHGNSIAAEYTTQRRNGYSKVIITHVTDKNDPNKIATDLKGKKGVDIIDVESLTADRSDLIIRFIQFDVANSSVKNNICRIKKSSNNKGSVVFQYVERKHFKQQAQGSVLPDFTKVAENMKELPVEKYSTSLSQRMNHYQEEYEPWYQQRQRYQGQWGRYPIYE